jgi:uncharacterized protein (DUF1778 family)
MTARQGRDRRHSRPRRPRPIFIRCSDDEYAALAAAATSSGLTPSGYAAEAAVAAAHGRLDSLPDPALVRELIATRAQLRRYGSNLNQAARALNAGGDPPEWLNNAIALTDQVVHNIDEAVQNLLDPPHNRA